MKGRTTCPNCEHKFVLRVPEDKKIHKIICPSCKKSFTIKTDKCDKNKTGECSWEEHGEPRKTILSKIKPRTNKPMIAFLLLVIVFCLGISTSVFSEKFIEINADVVNAIGFEGTLEVVVFDKENNTLEDVMVIIGGNSTTSNSEGIAVIQNVEIGIQTVDIYRPDLQTVKQEVLVVPFFTTHQDITLEKGETHSVYFNTLGCSLILGIFSVFALLSAITCFRRKNFDVAVAGAILGIFSFGFLFIGSVLSIIAFFMIIKSKEEFDDGKKGKIF